MKVERLLGAGKEYWVFSERERITYMFDTSKYPKKSFAVEAYADLIATEEKRRCIREIAQPIEMSEIKKCENEYYYVFDEESFEKSTYVLKTYYLHEESGEYFVTAEIIREE